MSVDLQCSALQEIMDFVTVVVDPADGRVLDEMRVHDRCNYKGFSPAAGFEGILLLSYLSGVVESRQKQVSRLW